MAVSLDPFKRIINVHWGSIYLYVKVSGRNSAFSGGPAPVDPVIAPSATVVPKGITLIEQRHDPQSTSSFTGCMQYEPPQQGVIGFGPGYFVGTLTWSDPIYGPVGQTAQQAYDMWRSGTTSAVIKVTGPVDGACSTAVVQFPTAYQTSTSATESRSETYYVNLVTVPIGYSAREQFADEYVYRISPGVDLLSIKVKDLIETIAGQIGVGEILANVYSRTREEITRPLDQLLRLTPDDTRKLVLDSTKQGPTFKVGVYLDTNEEHQQTDNYGYTFQPYKVTFTPTLDSVDIIPEQPPPRLALPSETPPTLRQTASVPMEMEEDDPALAEGVVQEIDKTVNTNATPGCVSTTTLLHSISYYYPNTNDTRTVVFIPK